MAIRIKKELFHVDSTNVWHLGIIWRPWQRLLIILPYVYSHDHQRVMGIKLSHAKVSRLVAENNCVKQTDTHTERHYEYIYIDYLIYRNIDYFQVWIVVLIKVDNNNKYHVEELHNLKESKWILYSGSIAPNGLKIMGFAVEIKEVDITDSVPGLYDR